MQSSFFTWGCHKVSTVYKNITNQTAIDDIVLFSISVYPIPTSGQINITSAEQNIQLISIYNLSGIQLFSTQYTALDISHLTTGIYFIRITTPTRIITKKIVKM